jgi:SAM-dependent methyltransferase
MAISIVEYQLVRSLQEQNLFPRGGELLEVGEANWYGDISLDLLRADIARFAAPERRAGLLAELDAAAAAKDRGRASWDIAKIFWQTFLAPASITAIDYHGTEIARKLDLNQPIDLGRQFDIVHNAGTLEHVFDIAQGFRNIHNLTRPGGFMIHHGPFVGWVDHGFYALQPTLFWDLAEANNYRIHMLLYAEIDPPRLEAMPSREAVLEMAKSGRIGRNANLAAVLRRPPTEEAFRVPMQGYYAGRISQEAVDAWSKLR